jgi:hypothetical protein
MTQTTIVVTKMKLERSKLKFDVIIFIMIWSMISPQKEFLINLYRFEPVDNEEFEETKKDAKTKKKDAKTEKKKGNRKSGILTLTF